jgi:citrate lyase subunit beta / citryl-CoA lyase
VRAPRARRSELATPASSERMCEKAASSGADLVFLDLEDACAPAVKESARSIAVGALTGQDWGATLRAVRVNGIDTPWCHGDIIEIVTGARDCVDVLIVPKVRRARDVWWVDVLLTQLETTLRLPRPIGLEVLIEEAEGLANALEIAQASERLEALIFGAGDLSASLRARVDGNFDPVGPYPGDFWHFARVQVLTAARAGLVDAIDAPYPAYQDPAGYRASALQASVLGYDGKWAMCPSPTRSSPRRPPRWPRPVRPWPPTGSPRRSGWAPSDATASWWTPPTCVWPPIRCTRRRWPGCRESRLPDRQRVGSPLPPAAMASRTRPITQAMPRVASARSICQSTTNRS